MRLYIDPGHGGEDSGAKGAVGLLEKDLNLQMAWMLGLRMAESAEIRYSRFDDRNVSERSTAEDANFWGASFLLSLHCNGFTDPAAQGFEVLRHEDDEAAQGLADRIMDGLQVTFPDRRRRSVRIISSGDRGETILRVPRCPAVIVEPGFITNPVEEEWLATFLTQAQIADVIGTALEAR